MLYPCKECHLEHDSEYHLAEHLLADHNQPALLDQLEERYDENEDNA